MVGPIGGLDLHGARQPGVPPRCAKRHRAHSRISELVAKSCNIDTSAWEGQAHADFPWGPIASASNKNTYSVVSMEIKSDFFLQWHSRREVRISSEEENLGSLLSS